MTRTSRRGKERQRGTALLLTMIMTMAVAGLCVGLLMVAAAERRSAMSGAARLSAQYLAQAGVEEEILTLNQMKNAALLNAPFAAFDNLVGQTAISNASLVVNDRTVGTYTVTIPDVRVIDSSTREVHIHSVGTTADTRSGHAAQVVIDATVEVKLGASEVFDYVYFINNWGWYFGNTITANGNVRSNGQFDFGGYRPRVNGIPRFDKFDGAHFSGSQSDGGVFSGWDIVNDQNVRKGPRTDNHAFAGQIPMPNLSDLGPYEEIAEAYGSSIRVGNRLVCHSVVGKNSSDKQNLFIIGTQQKPIIIDGPVVVRGNVVIAGVVTGNGAIYAGGNVYIPQNLTYKNPPASYLQSPDKNQMEDWVASSGDADSLGLFAREHVVIGDYTNNYWQYYVNRWVNDYRNKSEEDAGADGIPNTKAGRDGILGTADDDVLENDNTFTVERYTQEMADKGLIPEGKGVGDAIPGTGEDIDGDGQYDPTTRMSEFDAPDLKNKYWVAETGNDNDALGAHKRPFSDISTVYDLTQIDAAIYTNHTVAALTLAYGEEMVFNGCVVSRNEAIVYGTTGLKFNYDFRLLGGGEMFGFHLPKTWKPVEVKTWTVKPAP